MNLIECDCLRVDKSRFYGGATGSKVAVWYNDTLYMLKRHQLLRGRNLRNVEISYANDCVSEYIGSHVYSIAGIPVHETLLGSYMGGLCVLCSDVAYPGRIVEFKEFRNTLMEYGVVQPSSGMSTSIEDILQVIDLSDRIDSDVAKERFWTMFVIDTIIGNCDRNNGNWGVLTKSRRIAAGSCL